MRRVGVGGRLRQVARALRRSKYGAVKVTVDNITFHSKREAARYGELKLLEKAGEISGLSTQVHFALKVQPTSPDAPLDCTIGHYVADFTYWEPKRRHVVEDVKGVRTPLYKWKKKHVEAQYGIQIRET